MVANERAKRLASGFRLIQWKTQDFFVCLWCAQVAKTATFGLKAHFLHRRLKKTCKLVICAQLTVYLTLLVALWPRQPGTLSTWKLQRDSDFLTNVAKEELVNIW